MIAALCLSDCLWFALLLLFAFVSLSALVYALYQATREPQNGRRK